MNKKVLLIDDELCIREMLAEQLKKRGYDVATAENGEEGLQRFEQEKSDLILLDVVMPGMDGFGFFKAIKKDPQKSHTRVIVLTARGGMKATFDAFEADDFITKPFEVDDLLIKIEFCLARKALVFGDDPAFINVVKKALEKSKCQVEVAANDEELFSKGKKSKYDVFIAHLALIKKEPADFLLFINKLKTKRDKLILYCDSLVKGMEEGDTVASSALKTKWERAGIESFFDPRTSQTPFSKLLSSYFT